MKAGCMWTDRLMFGWDLNWVPPGRGVGVGLLCDDFSELLFWKRSRFGQRTTFITKHKKSKKTAVLQWMPEDCGGLGSGSE